MQLEVETEDGVWKPVIRYDCAHNFADRDHYRLKGDRDKEEMPLRHGKVVIVEPLVSSSPVLTLLLTAIFLRDLEALSSRVIVGALLTVTGTVLVVLAK